MCPGRPRIQNPYDRRRRRAKTARTRGGDSRCRSDGDGAVQHLAEDLWPVTADPGHTRAVLLELADNARQAIPATGTLSSASPTSPSTRTPRLLVSGKIRTEG
jgi:hypothetical protein